MILPNNTGGWFLQSLIILANQTDHSPNNTFGDYLHLPIGASTGEYWNIWKNSHCFEVDESVAREAHMCHCTMLLLLLCLHPSMWWQCGVLLTNWIHRLGRKQPQNRLKIYDEWSLCRKRLLFKLFENCNQFRRFRSCSQFDGKIR